MQSTVKAPDIGPAKVAEITSAVRALCVIFNTSLSYNTAHVVFSQAVEERIPVFETALSGMDGITLFFSDSHVLLGSLSIEPGSEMFQKLSQRFEAIGVGSIDILPGVTADALTKLIEVLSTTSDKLPNRGLQRILRKAGVKTIGEHSVRRARTSSKAGSATKRTRASRARRAAGSVPDAVEVTGVFTMKRGRNAYASRTFETFVRGALGAFSRGEATLEEVAEIISSESDRRVAQQIGKAQRKGDRKARRLETIRDLVLKELEHVGVAAIIVGTNLAVLAANALALEIIGDLASLTKDSALESFIASGQEKQQIRIGGELRSVHLLTSSFGHGGENIMLISFE